MSDWHSLRELLDAAPGAWSLCVCAASGAQLFGYDEHALRSSASLIKVPLAMAFVDLLPAALDEVVELDEASRVSGEGSFDSAPAGTRRTLRALVAHALQESDNTASNLLIDRIGCDAVNGWLRARGLQTRLERRLMDFAALKAGRDNRTTAADMCRLFALVQQPQYAALLDLLRDAVGTGKLEAGLPKGTPLAHKVGDLPGAEHDAGIVWAPHAAYLIAVLGVELPDAQSGRDTIAAAAQLVWQHMTAEPSI